MPIPAVIPASEPIPTTTGANVIPSQDIVIPSVPTENLPIDILTPKPTTAPTGLGQADLTGGVLHMDGAVGGVMTQLNSYSAMDLLQMLIVYAFIIAGILSAIFIFIGGISFILSSGNEEKIKKAINTIRYSIVGLIITILSFTFITIIGRIFGLNFLEYITFDKIRESISIIVSPKEKDNNDYFSLPKN